MPDFVIQRGYLAAYNGHDANVVIPDGVTCIGRRVFYMGELTAVVIPKTVEEIEAEAFGLSSLEEICFEGTVKKVGKNAFPKRESLARYVFSAIPIKCFSKADQEYAFLHFLKNYDNMDGEILKQNLAFVGKNLFRPISASKWCDKVIAEPKLFREVLAASEVSAGDVEPLMERMHDPEELALLLQYSSTLRVKKKVKADADIQMTVDDWRKLYRFRYRDGAVEITGCMDQSDDILVPDRIGNKTVRAIGRRAFDGHDLPDKESFETIPDKRRSIVFPEGIREFKSGALFCINNRDIYLPESAAELPSGLLVAVDHIALHIPASVTTIPDDLIWDSPEETVIIKAPRNSFARQYAERNGIAFCEINKEDI